MIGSPPRFRRVPLRERAHFGLIVSGTLRRKSSHPRWSLFALAAGSVPKRERGRRPGRPEPRPLTQVLVGPVVEGDALVYLGFRLPCRRLGLGQETNPTPRLPRGVVGLAPPASGLPLRSPSPAPFHRLPRCGHCPVCSGLASARQGRNVHRARIIGAQRVDNCPRTAISASIPMNCVVPRNRDVSLKTPCRAVGLL